jgi:hypothetical protein
VAAAAHGERELMLTRKTESGHDIIIALGTHNHCRASRLIEDFAQFIIRWAGGHNHLPRYAIVEFGYYLRIHI